MSYPVSRIFGLTLSRKAPHYLTKEEVHHIISLIRKPRDQMIIDFLWNTGVRVSELINVRVSDIDSYVGVVTVKTLKQKRPTERSIPIPKEFLNRILDYAEYNSLIGSDFLFHLTRQDIFYLVSRYCKLAGIDKKRSHPHIFRHSFAVNCVIQGISGTVLAEWLGHSGLGTVMIYARALAKDTKHLRDGLEF
jgi:integrase/recombinase XerD